MLLRHFNGLAAAFHGPRHPLALMFSQWPVSDPEESVELSSLIYRQSLKKV